MSLASWVAERDVAAAAGLRLFCLPHAGAGVAGFYRWRRSLPVAVALCPVQLPGRERRAAEPAAVRATALAAELLAALGPLLHEPYAIFGHSMGSLLGYELARQAVAAGLPAPRWLFASGRGAPQAVLGRAPLHALPEQELLLALGQRFGGAPDALLADPELRALFLPTLRRDLELVETYVPPPASPVPCALAAFAGESDPSISEAALSRWKELASGPFLLERFPGDHFFHLGAGQSPLLATLHRLLTIPAP